MGRKPVLALAGALATSLALAGCQSSPPPRPIASPSTTTIGQNNPTGVKQAPTTTTPASGVAAGPNLQPSGGVASGAGSTVSPGMTNSSIANTSSTVGNPNLLNTSATAPGNPALPSTGNAMQSGVYPPPPPTPVGANRTSMAPSAGSVYPTSTSASSNVGTTTNVANSPPRSFSEQPPPGVDPYRVPSVSSSSTGSSLDPTSGNVQNSVRTTIPPLDPGQSMAGSSSSFSNASMPMPPAPTPIGNVPAPVLSH
jgi:hypothetical protein